MRLVDRVVAAREADVEIGPRHVPVLGLVVRVRRRREVREVRPVDAVDQGQRREDRRGHRPGDDEGAEKELQNFTRCIARRTSRP